ncbi:MAG TPA: lipid A deacylase LpxR family protein [Verrucomicrobiae bacterium]|nr:lipid A deacylase LpxR family protein [Verrucomicrobiae bacterium]
MNLARRIIPGRHRVVVGFVGLILVGAGWRCDASAPADGDGCVLALTVENDSFANPFGEHQDRHYTAGLKMVLFGGDDFASNLTGRLNKLADWGINPEAGNLGWIIVGQNIYTPEKILDPAPIKTDRPYAGWLYTGAVYQRRGALGTNVAVMENFEINLGVVGPDAIGEEAQKTIHRWWFPDDIPKGWDHQLKNEPGLVLKYARLWRYSPTAETARYADVIPYVGGDLGNVFTFATAGTTVRLGCNLPRDFGVPIIDSPASINSGLTRQAPWWYAYGFGGVAGRAVGHDITLDGNSFRGGPSVDKNIWVGDLSWGFAVQMFRHLEVAYTRIIRTEEFRGQDGNDKIGSFTIKGTFCF